MLTKIAAGALLLAAVAVPASAEDLVWRVTVEGIHSTWRLHVAADGSVTGDSAWPANDVSGPSNPIDGKIAKNGATVKITRHLEAEYAGQTQVYTGSISANGMTAEGDMSGTGGPSRWSARIGVPGP